MKRNILYLLLLVAQSAFAVIAEPNSGLVGDEWCHYKAGETISEAQLNARRMAARQFAAQMSATFPKTGKVRSIVILVNFTDVSFVTENPRQAFYDMLNKTGYSFNGGTGSARDYFLSASNNTFLPDFDVYGPYTLSHNQAYYGGGTGDRHDDYSHIADMVREACQLANNDGVNFVNYDENNDGLIDNVFVYYAGYNEADGGGEKTIWPHRSVVTSRPTFNGKKLYDYACSSELMTDGGRKNQTMCGIGTFCHEFSHVLGLPDMYNTVESSTYTVGSWDIMSSGNYNNKGKTPPTYSAFERYMMGWLTPEQLSGSGDHILEPLTTSNRAFLLATSKHNLKAGNPSPTEFWMVENRQHTGWETPGNCIPGEGLIISHITHRSSTWTQNTYNNTNPLGYDICEAYNSNPKASSASDTYPGSFNITRFTPTNNSGTKIDSMALSNILALSDKRVIFHFGKADIAQLHFDPHDAPTCVTTYDKGIVEYSPICITLVGKSDKNAVVGISSQDSYIYYSLDQVNWTNNILIDTMYEDSTYSRKLYIRYEANRQCRTQTGTIYATCGAQEAQLVVSCYAPRPTYIQQVKCKEASEVTPYSFTANWIEQKDAEYYYLTLYKTINEASEKIQDFTDFNNQDAIKQTGWNCNFTRRDEAPSGGFRLLFKQNGETLITEEYLYDVTELAFYVSQSFTNTQSVSGGQMILEGKTEDMTWEKIDEFSMRPISSGITKTYSDIAEKKYRQFRISYSHIGGIGGIYISDWTARFNQKAEYIYKEHEYEIFAPANSAAITGLEPHIEYYYSISCYENKGCQPNETLLSKAMHVKTLFGTDKTETQFTVLKLGDGEVTAFLPIVAQEDQVLYVFDTAGKLIESIPVEPNAQRIEIPTTPLTPGHMYVVKYTSKSKMNRKDLWSKFTY